VLVKQIPLLGGCRMEFIHLSGASHSMKDASIFAQLRMLSHFPSCVLVRRLVYGKGDTLLIARAGFGKSLIPHPSSVKIILLIHPWSDPNFTWESN